MLKKAVPNLKRWVSGYLVAVMTLMLVFNNSFAFSALAAETASGSNAEKEASASDAFKNSKVSLKNSQKEDVQFLIFSEQSSYEPGETVCLDLYIKNNTDKTITDGLLKIARAKGIEEDSAYFEDMTDLYEAANREEEKPEETTAEETKAEETEEGTSAEEKEELTAESSEEIGLESAETPEITEAAENVEDLLPTESESAVSKEENLGTEVADTEAAEIKDTAAPEPTAETIEREAEETVEEGSAAVEDEESSASAEDEISEDDEEEKEEEEDPERLSELEILPGKTAYINFYYTIDPEIEGMKDQKVDFSFAYTLEDEEGKQTKNTLRETFRYAVDALNLMTVTAGGEKGYVETGKEDEMLLEFDLGLMREVLEEAIEEELEKTENGDASAAEAKRASASELLVGWEDENGERPLGKKDPAVIKNLKCEVETFGVKLDKFKAIPVKDDDNFGTSLKCSFYVSRKTLPGTYYGRVNASYKIKGKSFHTTQGFKVVVKQETGEMELVGKIGDSEIIMTGPVSSFPKADELSLKVSEITQEQQEKVDEALQKKAEEEGSEISQYKALDIKLMADGVETEPEGDVQVRFKNVNLEKVDEKKEAEQEKAEEKSIVKKAVRKVMSLFSAGSEEEDAAAVAETETEVEAESKDSEDGKAEGSEEAAGETGEAAENSENIKVLHLDEDAIVANEMKSEVQENGDVVMDTDHFSIYIVVDMDSLFGEVNLTVQHYANIDYPSNSYGISSDPVERLKRINEFVPIYSEDQIKLDNQLKREIKDLSKVCINNSQNQIVNYTLFEVWILKNNNTDKTSTKPEDWYRYKYAEVGNCTPLDQESASALHNNQFVLTKEEHTIRMVYTPVNKILDEDVTFYDYNVTDGKNKTSSGKVNLAGINLDKNYEGGDATNRIAVGQNSTGVTHSYNEAKTSGGKFLNQANGTSAATGMVTGVNKDGPVYTEGVFDPGLFNSSEKEGKKILDGTNGSESFYLRFNQKGNVFTLSEVYQKGRSNPVLKELDELDKWFSRPNWNNTMRIYTNSFWPLDYINDYPKKDPHFGKRRYPADDKLENYGYHYSGTNDMEGNFTISDDGKWHNWFFGMRYDFQFTLGDYIGPLKFYFAGDDDFWLFLDGELVEDIDIGGIHSSIGKLTDLKEHLRNADKNETHQLTVIYAERGGTGSTCYMEFMLPNVKQVDFDTEAPKKKIKVNKIWDDNYNPYREPITVKLSYRKNNEFGTGEWIEYGKYTLTSANATNENEWSMELGSFPSTGYEYKIEEVSNLPGYNIMYGDGNGGWTSNVPNVGDNNVTEIKNTLVPKVHVKVKKIWNDKDDQEGNRPQMVNMQLQYKKENSEEYLNYPGDAGRLTLDGIVDSEEDAQKSAKEIGEWEGIFEDLPYYIDGEAVTYRVRELKEEIIDGEKKYIVVENQGNLPGKFQSSDNIDWSYKVTYQDEDNFPELSEKPSTDAAKDDQLIANTTVTNTFEPRIDRYVIKNWEGVPDEINVDARIGLYQKSEENDWTLVKHWAKKDIKTNSITWAESTEDGAKEEDFILTFNSNLLSLKGAWKGLPKYDQNNQIIEYSIFELDVFGKPIEASITNSIITTIGDYRFEVTQEMPNSGEEGKENVVTITNKYMFDLNITKEIGGNASSSKKFKFTAEIKKDNETIILPNPTESDIDKYKGYTVDAQGVISFELGANETITIPVPSGCKVEIKEDEASHAGYYVKFKINGKEINGDTINVEIPDKGITPTVEVVCTNTPGAVLPDTGGPGLLMMSRLGWMLLLLALLMAGMEIQFYGERRNRKAAAVQREDTRGFDSDDY